MNSIWDLQNFGSLDFFGSSNVADYTIGLQKYLMPTSRFWERRFSHNVQVRSLAQRTSASHHFKANATQLITESHLLRERQQSFCLARSPSIRSKCCSGYGSSDRPLYAHGANSLPTRGSCVFFVITNPHTDFTPLEHELILSHISFFVSDSF